MDLSSDEDLYRGSSPADLQPDSDEEPSAGPAPPDAAPKYTVPNRVLGAVEIPAVVENVDRAIKAFGRRPDLQHVRPLSPLNPSVNILFTNVSFKVMDPIRNSIPFYLTPEDPFCKPIMSHNARSHNVVLKVTVRKRTGRKRKRGTNDPWEGDIELPDAETEAVEENEVHSRSRLDDPKILRRKLEDNVNSYQVEAVGVIKHTHRFRGLADFYWDMTESSFANRYVDQVLPGDGMSQVLFVM